MRVTNNGVNLEVWVISTQNSHVQDSYKSLMYLEK